jgi:hypothetical protein
MSTYGKRNEVLVDILGIEFTSADKSQIGKAKDEK